MWAALAPSGKCILKEGNFNGGPARAALRIHPDRHVNRRDCGSGTELLCGREGRGAVAVTCGRNPRSRTCCARRGNRGARLVLITHGRGAGEAQEWSVRVFGGGRDGFLYGRGTLDTKGSGSPLVRALRREGGILRRNCSSWRTRTRRSRRRGSGIFRAEPAYRSAQRADERGGVGDRHLRRRREVLPAEHVGEGPVWMKLPRREGGARKPASAKDARAPDSGVDARDGTPGPGAAYGACPGDAAVLRAKDSPTSTWTRRGGAEEAAALEALGPGSRDRPAAAQYVRGDDARGRVQAERDPVLARGRSTRGSFRARNRRRWRRGCGRWCGPRRFRGDPLRGEANGCRWAALRAMEAAVLSVHPDAVVVPYMSTGFTDSALLPVDRHPRTG